MRFSRLVTKTNKVVKKYDSVNATLLQKGGFIDQTMAGVFTFLPLGLRVLSNIEQIVREEMNTIATELLMPALSPKMLWERTGRLETVNILFEARGANDTSRKLNESSYVLNSTHEELITPIVQQFRASYRDLPCAVYQIQTKFRNEPRPKSGLLRGREFRMNDLYSFHSTEEDFQKFYEDVQVLYMKIFHKLGIGKDTHIALASGGDFSKSFSHEFDTECSTGEDHIYYDEKNNTYYNREVARKELVTEGDGIKVSEVGNIFPLGTKFSDAFGYKYTDEEGKKRPVYMGSYGIGTSRIMGVIVEKFHDEKGILWPQQVTPFPCHIILLDPASPAQKRAEDLYDLLLREIGEVLFDDRLSSSAGEKFADADLIGIPYRIVVSKKNAHQVEVKSRHGHDVKHMDISDVLNLLRASDHVWDS